MTLNLETIDKDCNALNVLFEAIISDMKVNIMKKEYSPVIFYSFFYFFLKNSPPLWEDFTNKASKLQTQLK